MKSFVPLLIMFVSACTPGQRRTATTALDLASAACVLVRGILEDGSMKSMCVSPEMIIPLAKSLIEPQCSATPRGVEAW